MLRLPSTVSQFHTLSCKLVSNLVHIPSRMPVISASNCTGPDTEIAVMSIDDLTLFAGDDR